MTRKTSSITAAAKSRCRAFWLSAISALLAISPALAGPVGMVTPDRWRPHADVGILDHVTLRMHWYDSLEQLREAAPEQAVGDGDLQGFSILRRNTETGAWICDVFVVKMRGALVDNDRTMTFGHELLHCFGLRHDE
ncbi:MAG TPA: hypothetical protein VNA66_05900 [Gammaproteobacteria bacterium]|nr:hypothetical protein [Gammaproteobacteria bacterium]